jgi:hypothetical protein
MPAALQNALKVAVLALARKRSGCVGATKFGKMLNRIFQVAVTLS